MNPLEGMPTPEDNNENLEKNDRDLQEEVKRIALNNHSITEQINLLDKAKVLNAKPKDKEKMYEYIFRRPVFSKD